jgi:uncharacterized protein YaeQ
MALKSTILKVQLHVSDMDRQHFQEYSLTLAQHPSETHERVMVRLLAFALHAGEGSGLQFGTGLSSDEPDLWRKDLTGLIECWIEVGQPDEQYIRRACGRSRQVVVYNYNGRSAQVWWDKAGESLQRCRNLTVIDIDPGSVAAIGALARRSMQIQCFIQDGAVHLMGEGDEMVPVTLSTRMGHG